MTPSDLLQFPEYRFLAENQDKVRMQLDGAFRGGWDPGGFVVFLVDGRSVEARLAVQDWKIPFQDNLACVAMESGEALKLMRTLHHTNLDMESAEGVDVSVLPKVFIVTSGDRGVLYVGHVPLAGRESAPRAAGSSPSFEVSFQGFRFVRVEKEPKAA